MGMSLQALVDSHIDINVIAKHQSIILNKIIEKNTKTRRNQTKRLHAHKTKDSVTAKKSEDENEIMELAYMGKISIIQKKKKKKTDEQSDAETPKEQERTYR